MSPLVGQSTARSRQSMCSIRMPPWRRSAGRLYSVNAKRGATSLLQMTVICLLRSSTLVAGLIGFISCQGSRPKDGEEYLRTQTGNRLRSIAVGIDLSEHATGEPAPTSMPALVEWLRHYGKPLDADYDNKTIRDMWGREVQLTVQDGKLRGLSSAGSNGIWEGGQGDDIRVLLDEVRESGSKGERRCRDGSSQQGAGKMGG